MKIISKVQTPSCDKSTRQIFGLCMLILFSISCTSNTMNDNNPEVETINGMVRGVSTNNYTIFQGIPYAKPPVGELRWKSPQPIDNWSGIKETVKPAPKCMQLAAGPGSKIVGSEDCLYLNITKPASANRMSLRPVIVELHGGGFHSGAGAEMDGRRLAVLGDVVVVTINYRLGVFGYFGYPGLDGSGSFALQDQLAALKWVHDNISAFGGNPRNVTLMGQSSGAYSTGALLTSPLVKGLIHKAIIQSGSPMMSAPFGTMVDGLAVPSVYISQQENEQYGSFMVSTTKLGCEKAADPLACLRNLPAKKLMPIHQAMIVPAYGGALLPQSPVKAIMKGKFNRIPIIIGNTHDEELGKASEPLDEKEFDKRLKMAFDDDATKVKERYSSKRYQSFGMAWSAIVTDRVWVWPSHVAVAKIAPLARVYQYEFNDPAPPQILAKAFGIEAGKKGAFHGADVVYAFPSDELLNKEQTNLSDNIIRYFSAFARNANPNVSGLPEWKSSVKGEHHTLLLSPGKNGIKSVDYVKEHNLDLWDAIESKRTKK
ncbi:carboxylesterase family protein [Mucilaginibacter roseus]|uniref:Carboxylic ester hydrolase n=1 Tax=Mucilaginibacter roseus TaxID=1528868 RepID=A0ABS8TWT7_9SPHI|nr:carboxylesterase family protein [Mucilaginibacter roseus]MCD8739348.1 carboxylesterase family protein [Mucilaginibacter roseus]